MYVHSRAGLAGCNLGGETYIQPIFESQIPDNPFCKQQLVRGSFYWIWQELYFILRGEGQYQVDGEIFPVSEGCVIRVSPDGKRALKNTGNENLTMLCVQYKGTPFTEADSPMTDGVILQEELKW